MEWGDVATWAGAVASSVAVGIALWLGARDIIARRAEEKRLTRILSILLAPRIANAQNHLILVTKCGRHVQVWANADVAARAEFLNLVKTCPINLLAPQFYEKAPSIFQEGSASLARAHGLLSSAMYRQVALRTGPSKLAQHSKSPSTSFSQRLQTRVSIWIL